MIANHDGHIINGGGISLLHPDDKSEASSAWLEKDDEGVFQFNYVLEGDYILHVAGAGDYEYEEIPNPPHSEPPTHTESRMLRSYGTADVRLHVRGDVSGVTITVPDPPGQAAQTNSPPRNTP
jgi:hypothetical protein